MKEGDQKIFGDVRALLNTFRIDSGKLRIRISSNKVYLGGELVRTGGSPMKPQRLLLVVKDSLLKIRGVKSVIVETELEQWARRG